MSVTTTNAPEESFVLENKLSFLGWTLIKDNKPYRKGIIAYIKFLMEHQKPIVDGEYLRREKHYAVSSINEWGVNIITWATCQHFHLGFDTLSDTLLMKTLWNVAHLHRHLSLKQERVVRSAFRQVYEKEDEDNFPVYGVTPL